MRTIMALLTALALAGCASGLGGPGPSSTYRLGAAQGAEPGPAAQPRGPHAVIAVERPLATGAMASDRLVVEVDNELQTVAGARWEDAMPDIVALRAAEALQATGAVDVVDAAQLAGRADYALVTVLRAMQVRLNDDLTGAARTNIAARLVRLPERDVVATEVFTGRATAPNDRPAELSAAIDRATADALSAMAAWVATRTAPTG